MRADRNHEKRGKNREQEQDKRQEPSEEGNHGRRFVSDFPSARREREIVDSKWQSFRYLPLPSLARQNVIDALIAAGDLAPNRVSVAAARDIGIIKGKLMLLERKLVTEKLTDTLKHRFATLRKHEESLRREQEENTPRLKERLAKGESVTLAPRKSDFHFCGGNVNLDLNRAEGYRRSGAELGRWFDHASRPWANRELLMRVSDEVLDTSTSALSSNDEWSWDEAWDLDDEWDEDDQIDRGRAGRWKPTVRGIVLTYETYGPDQPDYTLALLGFPGVLEPLPGIRFANPSDQRSWDEAHDPRPFLKKAPSLLWDVRDIPELSAVYQKVYPISFEYFDNHCTGW